MIFGIETQNFARNTKVEITLMETGLDVTINGETIKTPRGKEDFKRPVKLPVYITYKNKLLTVEYEDEQTS